MLLERERRSMQPRGESNLDFKVDIPKFEGQLDPDLFLDWLRTIERIFEYKEVPEEKKVKLVALRLRKYASLWWTNLCAQRVKKGKAKIRTWEKMKGKLKDRFLRPSYLQDSYFKLHYPTQGNFSKPLPKSPPFNKGSSFPPPKPTATTPSTPQKSQAPQKSLTAQNRPIPGTLPPSKDLDHIALECPNRSMTTLAEWEASREEEGEEGKELCLMEEQVKEVVEVVEEEEEPLVLRSALSSIQRSKKEPLEEEVCLDEPLEEVEESPDEGELLVIRRALIGLPYQEEFDKKELKSNHPKKITLTPLKTPTPLKPKDPPQLGVFLTTLLKSHMCEYEPYKGWELLNQTPPRSTASHHSLLTPLIQTFHHVLPQETPHGILHVPYVLPFKGDQLCTPKCGVKEHVIRENHGGTLIGPLDEQKATSMLKEYYYGPKMSRDVEYYIKRFKRKDENEVSRV